MEVLLRFQEDIFHSVILSLIKNYMVSSKSIKEKRWDFWKINIIFFFTTGMH